MQNNLINSIIKSYMDECNIKFEHKVNYQIEEGNIIYEVLNRNVTGFSKKTVITLEIIMNLFGTVGVKFRQQTNYVLNSDNIDNILLITSAVEFNKLEQHFKKLFE
ncbi:MULTISPECIES: hypothetical protein [Staphylococcus]|nr:MULTISPECIES: hypothetical protein [Staphylococcus]EJY94717.1 hypothetical protein SARL_11841 [Staphylococcus arlettae CVD059]ERF49985.1 hypothetical protein N039_00870 [Staphylococcus sp. EGD-HP3]MCD9054333.1 hypothetical protein [Staphylococcus arlettae]MCP8715601.1 hypothetical protein [Staphylococcus arlettae]UXU48981.1 hypothetical protein MUA37_07870 [Staphylococcus arlettae]